MADAEAAKSTLLVMTVTYNEIENLPRLVERIFAAAPEVDLLVVDDNSPDGTSDWVRSRAASDPRVKLLCRTTERGYGGALLAGLRYAVDHGYAAVVNLDADHSHDPVHIPQLAAGLDPPGGPALDIVIGSRYVPGGSIEGWPLKRHLMSRAINFLSRWWLFLPARDCSGSFRCYRTATLARLDFDAILSRGYSLLEELLWRLAATGARIGEIPIVFRERTAGASKIRLSEGFRALGVFARLGPLRTPRPSGP